jgi:hypothetical protein
MEQKLTLPLATATRLTIFTQTVEPEGAPHVAASGMIIAGGRGMAYESHDYKASAAKLRQLARQVQSRLLAGPAPTNCAGVRAARKTRRGAADRTDRGFFLGGFGEVVPAG